ncbi:MAG: hypothetical protein LBP75_04560 [Planctomycetota bacterium]|jgi:hypothetical protein|nr:hypothetical protein [Planctomycetota bacterium]
MFRKLSAFFTMLAFILFSGTWVVRRMLGINSMDVTTMFTQSIAIIVSYFIIGVFLSRLGVALVDEYLVRRRQMEAERRECARGLYLAALAGTAADDGAPPAAEDAASPAGAAAK